MSNYEKYLKYKKKYLHLREKIDQRMRGGNAQIFTLEDEIFFWSRQMAEHLVLQSLGIGEPEHPLKLEAKELGDQWMKYFKTNFLDKGIPADPDLFMLTPDLLAKVGKIDPSPVLQMLAMTEKYQDKALAYFLDAKTGWFTWVFYGVIMHMQKETKYFKRKITGPPMTADEEVKFINEHHKEETGATAHWIDPSPENVALVKKVESYALQEMKNWPPGDLAVLKGMNTGEKALLIHLTHKYSAELTKMAADLGHKIDNKQVKTVISPVLAKHIFREFARFTYLLEVLEKHPNKN